MTSALKSDEFPIMHHHTIMSDYAFHLIETHLKLYLTLTDRTLISELVSYEENFYPNISRFRVIIGSLGKSLSSSLFCDQSLQKFCKVSSVIRLKGESQKEVTRKESTENFPKNDYFLPPGKQRYMCVSGDKNCSFLGKFGVLCFLVTYALRFVLLPYYRRFDPSPPLDSY